MKRINHDYGWDFSLFSQNPPVENSLYYLGMLPEHYRILSDLVGQFCGVKRSSQTIFYFFFNFLIF